MSNQPGTRLDGCIAVMLFNHFYSENNPDLPQYSTTWEGMGLIVEEMEKRGYEFQCSSHMAWNRPAKHFASFFKTVEDFAERYSDHSIPHAVAEAALGALEGRKYQVEKGEKEDAQV